MENAEKNNTGGYAKSIRRTSTVIGQYKTNLSFRIPFICTRLVLQRNKGLGKVRTKWLLGVGADENYMNRVFGDYELQSLQTEARHNVPLNKFICLTDNTCRDLTIGAPFHLRLRVLVDMFFRTVKDKKIKGFEVASSSLSPCCLTVTELRRDIELVGIWESPEATYSHRLILSKDSVINAPEDVINSDYLSLETILKKVIQSFNQLGISPSKFQIVMVDSSIVKVEYK